MGLYDYLKSRHLVEAVTSPDIIKALDTPMTIYAGFDPSADSLQAGNYATIMLLANLQRAGHKIIALVGGATGLIGDPSGKSVERKMQTVEQVQHNLEGIKENLSRFLKFDDPVNPAILVNNYDWYKNVSSIDFLRDICVNFRVPQMLSKESVRKRMEATDGGMTFTEFSYQILQGNDFLHLFDTYGCMMEVGGSDQWGNITAGTDLVHRMRGKEVYGLTIPLVCDSNGLKFGKSEGNAIFLDKRKTSCYDFYQFFFRSLDSDVIRYLRIFTFLPEERILELEQAMREHPEAREAQRVLAEEVTLAVHGKGGLEEALRATDVLFGGSIEGLSADTLESIFRNVRSGEVALSDMLGRPVFEVAAASGMTASKGEARRLALQGGLVLNGEKVSLERLFTETDLVDGRLACMRQGRKNHFILRVKR